MLGRRSRARYITGYDMDVCVYAFTITTKLHLHDISHVSLPRLVSAVVYMFGLNMINAKEIQMNASLDTQPPFFENGHRRMVPILSINPAPSFTRSTLCDAARWVVRFGRSRKRWREMRLTDGLDLRIRACYFFPPAAASAALFSSAVEEKRSVNQSHVGWACV